MTGRSIEQRIEHELGGLPTGKVLDLAWPPGRSKLNGWPVLPPVAPPTMGPASMTSKATAKSSAAE